MRETDEGCSMEGKREGEGSDGEARSEFGMMGLVFRVSWVVKEGED